jgi:hypothetical protein
MTKTIVLLLALMVSACATGYQQKGLSGGYSDTQIDENTFRVSYETKGTIANAEKVENMMLYRAAELTTQKGYDWFRITDRDGDENWHPTYGRVGITSTATIKMFKGAKPENDSRSYDAKSVMKYMGKAIGVNG